MYEMPWEVPVERFYERSRDEKSAGITPEIFNLDISTVYCLLHMARDKNTTIIGIKMHTSKAN